jgi:transcription elongation GreA/GreB family factor
VPPWEDHTNSPPAARRAPCLRTHRGSLRQLNERREIVKGRDMARALLGHLPTSADRYLVEEVARLRGRVRDLETELAELRAARESDQLLHELHQITSDASALA